MFKILFCPYCGSSIHENELYCVSCGHSLPDDLSNREKKKRKFNKQWYIPLSLVILFSFSFFMYALLLENKTSQAKELYEQGEEYLLEKDETEAKKLFNQALDYKSHFTQASTAVNYIKQAEIVHSIIDDTSDELDKDNYQQALDLIDEAEKLMKNYNGAAVNELINTLTKHRNNIKISQLNDLLSNNPNIDELKILLWEADAIKTDEAEKITENISNQIVDYTFVMANKQLNNNQFKTAKAIVEDGLRYATESEKLQSLQKSIEKEKVAFETTIEERLEQALTAEYNEDDKIKLSHINIEENKQNQIVIEGEVESTAKVPITSVKVDYSLYGEDGVELINNEVFVFPETLKPNGLGRFEFTHYEMDKEIKDISVEVNKITWFTN